MALGGVDTGSINPKLAPKHAPSAGGSGLTPADPARVITTGIIMFADATFEVISLSTIAIAIDSAVNPHRDCTPS